MQIGLAGLGRMGAAIGARIIEVGHALTVWNRSREKIEPLVAAGAKAAASPAALARDCEAVITILTDADAIAAVYEGPDGLLSGDVAGKLFIEMSTVRPATEVALAEKVKARGAAFVECPVSGTVGPARAGKLLGLMGGDDKDVARARPILDELCRRLEHCGPVGAGASMKLAVNLPLHIYWQALGEALALTRHLGLDPAKIVDVFADTSGGPNALRARGPVLAAMLKGGASGEVTFNIDGALKDLRTMLAEANARGLSSPLVERAIDCYQDASRRGLGDREASALSIDWATQHPR